MEIVLSDIHKRYGPARANDGVSLTVKSGAIHGILGENGAGKSTLMKILAGFVRRDAGRIRVDGRPADYDTPAGAAALGIGMLYQDPLDFPRLTALDNFRLGRPAADAGAMRARLRKLADRFSFDLRPDARPSGLTIGERQQLEILRLIDMGIRALILDEPTTGISETQKALLFGALKQLAASGRSVILVSHKLEDVEALCDEATALRHGRVTGRMAAPFDSPALMAMMFGAPPAPPPRRPRAPGKPVLSISGVRAAGGRAGLRDCDAVFREREVVGLAGLEGSGQGVFLRVAAGLKRPIAGQVRLNGGPAVRFDHHRFQAGGVHFLPGSRLEEGLIAGMDIAEHAALLGRKNSFFIRWAEARRSATALIDEYRIKGVPDSPVESLSGGNQQRLLLSFLPASSRLLLLENPTRGLDIESAHWVWRHLLSRCRNSGCGIVFSSPELDEILMVADRVLVFYNGAIVRDVAVADTDAHQLGLAIAGAA